MIQIKLKDTMSEFFAADGLAADGEGHEFSLRQKAFVCYSPSSDHAFTDSLPRNTRYLMPQWRIPDGNAPSLKTNLVMMPQRISWIAGNMPVYFYKAENDPLGVFANLEREVEMTFGVVDPAYRLKVRYFDSIADISSQIGQSSVVQFLPSDALANLVPMHVEPDTHYELHTKRALALSGLPTPAAQMIDFTHLSGSVEALSKSVAQAMDAIAKRDLPFVLKTNYCAGGRGTHIIHSEDDRATVLEQTQRSLWSDLVKLTPSNVHLHPCSLILTDFLAGDAVAVNFFVDRQGNARFSSATRDITSDSNHWLGSTIVYSDQARLKDRYSNLIMLTAKFLRSRDYYGPAGIDVIENNEGTVHIIDLNPRPTGSWPLGSLQHHFVETLSMDVACLLPTFEVRSSRERFIATYKEQHTTGQIIILAWCTEEVRSCSSACLAVGARTESLLQELCKNIAQWVSAMNKLSESSLSFLPFDVVQG